MIRVWIETSSTILRSGLRALLESGVGLEPAESRADADVLLREDAGVANHEHPTVLLNDAPPSAAGLRGRVRAILPRHAPAEQIVAAIHAAATGLVAVPFEASRVLSSNVKEPMGEALTPRELETLEMMAEGLSNKQIAYRLGISDHTAKFHVNSIFAKLEAGTRTEAVMRGIRMGLVKL